MLVLPKTAYCVVYIQKHDRQKDQQNQTSEFDQRIKQSIRQRDVHSELKKVIKNEINHFLISKILSDRLCETHVCSILFITSPTGQRCVRTVSLRVLIM